ncbi:MAG: hypothetical protein IV100_02360 [Myxococcales bacterium]|nr:hypothetical protein [Myxococcales bacterium]
MHDLRDVGGTEGGFTQFIVGFGLAILGGYLFLDRVTVHGGYWQFAGTGTTSFGITLIPTLLGLGALFYDGASKLGWLLFGGGLLVIFGGVIANLQIHFRATSLFSTLIVLGCLAAGIGMMLRSLRPVPKKRGPG